MQSMFKSQVKEIEQEVRKRDMLIEILQTRIQELQVKLYTTQHSLVGPI